MGGGNINVEFSDGEYVAFSSNCIINDSFLMVQNSLEYSWTSILNRDIMKFLKVPTFWSDTTNMSLLSRNAQLYSHLSFGLDKYEVIIY